MFYDTAELLRKHTHHVQFFVRRTADLPKGLRGQVKAFFSGIWSFAAARELDDLIQEFKPDVIEFQNIYPLISPSIFPVLKRHNIPVLYRCANYRLFCPTGLMLHNDCSCELCALKGEINCVRLNCENSIGRSVGYALRNRIARKQILDTVDRYMVLSSFQQEKFISWGVPENKISILPNFICPTMFPPPQKKASDGCYVAYAGRLSPEKGIAHLVAAARRFPQIEFHFAGHTGRMPDCGELPENVVLKGELPRESLFTFFENARIVVVPSVCYEGFGFTAIEAMLVERPVIASGIGGLKDIVVNGVTGLTVSPGDVDALEGAVRDLWNSPDICNEMGKNGRLRVLDQYSSGKYYEKLLGFYEDAVAG